MELFRAGTVTLSAQAAATLGALGDTAAPYLSRHQAGDWGEVTEQERRSNAFGARHGLDIVSRYRLADGSLLRIASNLDQGATAVQIDSEFVYGIQIGLHQGYALWASTYACEKNALIALEEHLLPALEAGLRVATVLDVGTGTGRYALRWARRGAHVTAVDQSAEMLAVARGAAERQGLPITFHQGALEGGLPVEPGSFDLVVCALMLCHVPDLRQAIGACVGAVRPGGHLLITDLHPGVTARGWQTEVIRPDVVYRLPTSRHSREGYLRAVEEAGCTILHVLDGAVRDVPPGYTSDDFIQACGDFPFCLLIKARKREGAS
jgi:2-polyprenyl-3-methyl-5-hydroxy-6-metoxy-1,4-benzoquinol methylase